MGTETSTTPKMRTRTNAKKPPGGSGLQKGIFTSTSKPFTAADVQKKKTEAAKKVPNRTAQGRTKDLEPIVHLRFDDRLGRKLLPGYTQRSVCTAELRRS